MNTGVQHTKGSWEEDGHPLAAVGGVLLIYYYFAGGNDVLSSSSMHVFDVEDRVLQQKKDGKKCLHQRATKGVSSNALTQAFLCKCHVGGEVSTMGQGRLVPNFEGWEH
jgi:hypothetical protein